MKKKQSAQESKQKISFAYLVFADLRKLQDGWEHGA